MSIDVPTESLAVPSHILLQELPNQGLIFLDLRSEEYFGLDAVGTRMYELLVATGSVEAAHGQLVEEYAVDPDQLKTDMSAFVDDLVERGLLVRESR